MRKLGNTPCVSRVPADAVNQRRFCGQSSRDQRESGVSAQRGQRRIPARRKAERGPATLSLAGLPSLSGKRARNCFAPTRTKPDRAGGAGRRAAGAAAVTTGPLASPPISQTFEPGSGQEATGAARRAGDLLYFWRPAPSGRLFTTVSRMQLWGR